MPSWKKVITSGSAAALSSLNVTGAITGSSVLISGSTGTLFSSNVDTLILTGSMIVTGSSVITGSLNVSQGITGSLFGTASWAANAVTASFVTTAQTASYVLNAQSSSVANAVRVSNNDTTATPQYIGFVGAQSGPSTLFTDIDLTYTPSTNTLNTTSSRAVSSSYAVSASYAPDTTFPYTGSALITGSLGVTGSLNVTGSTIIAGAAVIGSSSLGASENTLTLGARDNGSEGGQLGFNAPGGTYASASFIDLYQNKLRILKGTNVTSTGEVANWNMHNLQMALPAYNSVSAFPGTSVATLAVDSSGNIITVAGSGGGTVTSVATAGTVNGITLTGGTITTAGTITLGGTLSNVQSNQLATSSLMIGTTNIALGATASSLTGLTSVNATSFTGSLFGTSSWANNATTASFVTTAQTASFVTTAQTASFVATSSWASNATSASYAATASFLNGGTTNAFVQNGNSFGTTATLGTNDNQPLTFETNATEKMRIDSTGNVGIGTTTPNAKLDISGSVNISGSGIQAPLQISSGSTSLLFVSSSGRVGVGISNPSASLHTVGDFRLTSPTTIANHGFMSLDSTYVNLGTSGIGSHIRMAIASNETLFTQAGFFSSGVEIKGSPWYGYVLNLDKGVYIADDYLRFGTGRINSSGSLGIGTISPSASLDVSGSARITGNLTVTGSLIAPSITGSLFGTSSWAVSASWAPTPALATTASYALTSSNVQGGTANYIPIWNTATSLSSSAIYQSAGNVGIGTTSPSYNLDVVGLSRTQRTGVNGAGPAVVAVIATDAKTIGDAQLLSFQARNSADADVTYGRIDTTIVSPTATAQSSDMTFRVYNSGTDIAALTLKNSGNVGIGTTSPVSKLHVDKVSQYNSSAVSGSLVLSNLAGGNAVLDMGVDTNYLSYIQSRYISNTGGYQLLLNPLGGNIGIGTTTPNAKLDVNGNAIVTGSLNVTAGITGSLFGTSSWAVSASWAPTAVSASNSLTASYVLPLRQDVLITGSLNVTGSTVQIGNNTLLGNTVLSGSIIISGSTSPSTPTVRLYGDLDTNGVIRFDPVSRTIDNSISASYIYVSGSTQDLYFTQNGSGYGNTTRLRWMEGNLYTGLLSGGVISSTIGSTTFNVSSGSGIIVTLNATTSSADPFPTIQYVKWPTYTALPITNSGSAKITYLSINSGGTVAQQTVPIGSTDVSQWDTQIELGVVLHLSGSVSTGVYNSPQLGYGFAQRTDDFVRAFGPVKMSGHTLQASGSTLSIIKTAGTAYNNGANYVTNPNHPSTVTDPAVNVSKIYRYYVSGSTPIIDTGVANAGYTVIDPTKYVDTTGALASVPGGSYSIQRVFWIPNSPTNAFLVYYGNAKYNSSTDAATAIQSEVFTEAPNTAQNAILVGYIIVAGGESNLQNANIIQGGLFRAVNGIGNSNTSPLSTTFSSLSDVSVAGRTNGDLPIYNGSQWASGKALTGNYSVTGNLTVTGGTLIGTSSYAVSSSRSDLTTAVYTPGGTANQFLYQSAGGAGSATTSTSNITYDSANTSLNATNVGIASAGTFSSTLDRSNNISMHDGSFGIIKIRNNNVDKITIYRDGASPGEILLSGSVRATSGFTGSLFGTSSWAVSASWAPVQVSASYAATSSYANSFTIGSSNISTNTIPSSTAGANAVFTQATGSFTAAKYLYTVTNGANARTGEVMAVWNGTSVQYTDNSTLDIGSTTAVTASVSIVTSQARFNVQTTNAGWTIKSQVTYL